MAHWLFTRNLNFAMDGVALTASIVENSWSTATPLTGVEALSGTAMLDSLLVQLLSNLVAMVSK
jgi:hypothetical protein